MKISACLMRFCIVFALLMLPACGGGGGGGSSAPPAPAPNISLSQSSLAFGASRLNNLSGQTIEITNTGNLDLTIGQISKPGLPFSIPDASDFCSGETLAPYQSCGLTVQFNPDTQISYSGTFSVPSDDPDSPSAVVSLSGTGYGLNVWINQVNYASCPSITVEVTVTDPNTSANDAALASLLSSNFTLIQNGQFIAQPFTAFTNLYPDPAPVSLVLAVERSQSLEGIRSDITNEAVNFINLLGAEDQAAICQFYQYWEILPAGFTTAKVDLIGYLNNGYGGGQYTYLYEAVYDSIDRAAQGPANNRRAVVLISDGVEEPAPGTPPTYTLDQVIIHAKINGIPIFTIYIVDPSYDTVVYGNTEVLQDLASGTGGQFYYGESSSLQNILTQISSVLSNKYTITYQSPGSCSGTLNVQVDWVSPTGALRGLDSRTFP